MDADVERTQLLKDEASLLEEMEACGDSAEAADVSLRLEAVYDRLSAIDADRAEARAGGVLAKLGFSLEAQVRAFVLQGCYCIKLWGFLVC